MKLPDSVFDTLGSTTSAFDSLDSAYQEMTKEQRQETRHLVKDFVKGMVKGRQFDVISASGEMRSCFCSISRKLDRLKVSIGDKDKRIREIHLSGVTEVLANDDDDKAVTLALA